MKQFISLAILIYLRFWARMALALSRPTVIGITGSVGKSSARDAIATILKNHYATYVIEKGNSEIGIPLGILGMHVESLGFQTPARSMVDFVRILFSAPFRVLHLRGVRYLVAEMAVDEPDPPKNMEYLLTIIKPDISVFLNVFPVHTMQFEKTVPHDTPDDKRQDVIMRAIAYEKGKIITMSGCKTAVINGENPYVQEVISKIDSKANNIKLLTFGQNGNFDIKITDHNVSLAGTHFAFMTNKKEYQLYIKHYVLPKEYGEILAAGILVGLSVGLSLETMLKDLEKSFTLPAGRSTLLKGIKDVTIVDSSYNASRASVMAFLDLLATLKKTTKAPVSFLFGDMRELGQEEANEHEKVAKRIVEVVDKLYLVGPLSKKYVLPVVKKKMEEVQWFSNPYEAGDFLKSNILPQTILLVKGSQNTIFLEEAVKKILADPQEASLLCRQSPYWLEKKSQIS